MQLRRALTEEIGETLAIRNKTPKSDHYRSWMYPAWASGGFAAVSDSSSSGVLEKDPESYAP
jgi:hypothetical protein